MLDKIVLGTAQLGLPYGVNNHTGRPTINQSFEILAHAYEQGIRTLDTAAAYGDSLEVIGQFHSDQKKFKVLNKVRDFDQLEIQVKQSLEIAGIEYFDCLSFHSYEDYLDVKKRILMLNLREKGLIKKIGLSVYGNEQLERVLLEKDVDLIQSPFNLLDNESQRGSYLRSLKEIGIEVHVRSIFLQGLFFISVEKLNEKFSPLKEHLVNLNCILAKYQLTMHDACLGYVLSKSYIDKVVFGVETFDQLTVNLNSIKSKPDKNFCDEIDLIKVWNTNLLNPVNWK